MSGLPTSKRCPLCAQLLPAAAFTQRGAYLSSYCRTCASRREVERVRRKRDGLPPPPPAARRGAPVAAPAPAMPEHLDPRALAATVAIDGIGTVRSILAAAGAPDLRAALLAQAVERVAEAQASTTSPGRAVRRLLDPGDGG